MKIKKTFTSIFLITFTIGLVGYFLVPKIREKAKPKEVIQEQTIEIKQITKKKKPELKVYDVEPLWNNEPKFKIDLLETGEGFHGDDIKAISGETWLGLFEHQNKYFLRSSKIKVDLVYDDMFDHKTNKKTGKNLSVKGKDKPLFLIKGTKDIGVGEIETLFRGLWFEESNGLEKETTQLDNGFVKNFKLGNEEYKLEVKEGLDKEQQQILVLELKTNKKSQIIAFVYYYEGFEPVGDLLWVGDLDQDGKLDLYLSFYGYEKGGYSSGLFLSSEEETGKLVKEVAIFSTTGC